MTFACGPNRSFRTQRILMCNSFRSGRVSQATALVQRAYITFPSVVLSYFPKMLFWPVACSQLSNVISPCQGFGRPMLHRRNSAGPPVIFNTIVTAQRIERKEPIAFITQLLGGYPRKCTP
ncbi:hypothetical protein M404DRAFT_510842 [Pisolithus tinctorius Marx 270]|uniref:Uncharacterized protein n=1 Tax=Pisolithus tinctorius Marx 270 TaxID=870435 RepID=A0A0C3NCW2_PISTI|nr:hypothetical protein M404DRAFT_510842 [Pisolithus tinctorius Marx 270]